MTRSEIGKPPEPAASPDASPQAAAPGQPGMAQSSLSASAESSFGRPARGRGEPQCASSASKVVRSAPSRPFGITSDPAHGPAVALTPTAAPRRRPSPNAALAQGSEEVVGDLAAEHPPSRLSGLRTLLVSLGRRSLNQDMDPGAESDLGIEPPFEGAAARPAYPNASMREEAVPGNGASAHLTAQPEFLPPRPMVEPEAEREKEAFRPPPPRRDIPEGDEIQTLPSWRGQYRKKRYPPI